MTTATEDQDKVSDTPETGASGQTAEQGPAAKPNHRRARLVIAIVVLAVGGLGTLGYWYFFMKGIVYTDDARLAGHLVDLAPQISGRVIDVAVKEGQYVQKGQEAFRLDPATYEAVVKQADASLLSAKANLQITQAKLDRAVNGSRPEEIKAAEAKVRRLTGEEDLARIEFDRIQNAHAKGAATQDELDRDRIAYDSARYSREEAEQDLSLLKAGTREEDIQAARAEVELANGHIAEATAALAKAQSDLAQCVVSAPFDGWVVRRWLEPGAMPVPGQPVVSLFDPCSLRVDANIEEKYLQRVAVGDEVAISIDAYPSLKLTGRVSQILLATNSQFSLVPAEGVSGTYIKVSQRVPLRIAVACPSDVLLAPGLSVEARIHVGPHAERDAVQTADDD
jgi:membrane fusion protein (multidrug efflux system)